MKMIIIMGYKCKRGLSGENKWEKVGERQGYLGVKRIKVGYICIWRQHNETHEMLFHNRGHEPIQSILHISMDYHNETSLYY
jgi:hypothetical protein